MAFQKKKWSVKPKPKAWKATYKKRAIKKPYKKAKRAFKKTNTKRKWEKSSSRVGYITVLDAYDKKVRLYPFSEKGIATASTKEHIGLQLFGCVSGVARQLDFVASVLGGVLVKFKDMSPEGQTEVMNRASRLSASLFHERAAKSTKEHAAIVKMEKQKKIEAKKTYIVLDDVELPSVKRKSEDLGDSNPTHKIKREPGLSLSANTLAQAEMKEEG